jgi:hypothetical protein
MPTTPDKIGKKSELEPQPHGGALRRGGPGRPKGSVSLVAKLKAKLDEDPSRAEALMESLMRMAEGGDVQAMKIVLDRVDGPVATKIEGGDRAVQIEVTYVEDQSHSPEAAPGPAED